MGQLLNGVWHPGYTREDSIDPTRIVALDERRRREKRGHERGRIRSLATDAPSNSR